MITRLRAARKARHQWPYRPWCARLVIKRSVAGSIARRGTSADGTFSRGAEPRRSSSFSTLFLGLNGLILIASLWGTDEVLVAVTLGLAALLTRDPLRPR